MRSHGICSHSLWRAWISSCWLAGGCGGWWSMTSLRCSVGTCLVGMQALEHFDFQALEHIDIGSKEVLYIVMLINDTICLLLEIWQDSLTQNVINVTLSCQVSINSNQWCPLLSTDPSLYHDTTSTKWQDLLNAMVWDVAPLVVRWVFIDPSWWTHSRSSQSSTTGVTKVMVCALLSVGWCI